MVTLVEIIGKSKATISEALSLNKLPQAIRDECRQDPTVPKNVLVEIAPKKQERSMLTQFKQYRDKQAKAAAKETATPAPRKRTKAEALAANIGLEASKISIRRIALSYRGKSQNWHLKTQRCASPRVINERRTYAR